MFNFNQEKKMFFAVAFSPFSVAWLIYINGLSYNFY
jgi:hypothetical protein